MPKTFWAAIALCLLAAEAGARDIFVDNAGGNDRNAGLQRSPGDTTGPVRTIAKALRLAEAGDHVVLAKNEMPYHECVSLTGSRNGGFAPSLPFVLEGNGATLDGSAPIPDDAWIYCRDNIFRFRPERPIQAVLFLRGQSIPPLPLPRGGDVPPRLEPMQWCFVGGTIYFGVEPQKRPPAYKLSCAELSTGVTLYAVRQVVVRNLAVRGFQADGVAATAARDVLLDNVACTDNGQCGVGVGGGAQVAIVACNLAGNRQSQLMTSANSETHLLTSVLSGDTAPAWVDQGGRVYLGRARVEGGRREIKANDP